MGLEVKNLSFRYGKKGRRILSHFDMNVGATERIGMIAPSGYGKTTLCKLLSGYLKPEEGEILLDGKPLESYRGYCPVQMIWQHPEGAVDPRMRMKDILLEGDAVEERVLEKAGIKKEWMNRFPSELSGGELQRFCIARALGKGTRYLIADEITTMLDMINQSQIWHFLLEEIERRQIGLVVVSHHQALLDQVCTRQINLKDSNEKTA